MSRPLRIANCSGFYGDRLAAAKEMVEGGPIDVLTGDWLAELTMLILARQRMKAAASAGDAGAAANAGWARTFLKQMEQVLGTCKERGIKVVSNAGGLAPAGCADAVRELADRLGLDVAVAHVEGDDILGRLAELQEAGCDLANMDTGETLAAAGVSPITANAYLGGWGIAAALERGADVVVTGRVTDAALVVGPAAWHHGWARDDWDRLAGAVVAGHVIECGPQATGGNYSFFEEVPGIEHIGFPLAEVESDGSSVITKHPGTGGLVSVGTVTAQLLYEIGSPRYHNPDVTARFDSIELTQEGPDRVRIGGVKGEPPPPTTKVAMNYLGGFRNTMTFVLTGLDIEAKADVAQRILWAQFPGGPDAVEEVETELIRTEHDDPATNDAALAYLRVTVKDHDDKRIGRAFSSRVIETALASYPGFFSTSLPGDATPYGVYWPALVPAERVPQTVVLDGEATVIEAAVFAPAEARVGSPATGLAPGGPTRRAPLGRVVGARSGDKGGNANIGVWARDDGAYAWLESFLTAERLQALLPEAAKLRVERYSLPNLRAVNFVLHGLLGRGVAASSRTDPQAKGLGEYLRAKVVDVPETLL